MQMNAHYHDFFVGMAMLLQQAGRAEGYDYFHCAKVKAVIMIDDAEKLQRTNQYVTSGTPWPAHELGY